MHDLYMCAMHWINTIDSQGWLMVLVASVVLGFFMLRGFGSTQQLLKRVRAAKILPGDIL